MCAMGKLLLVLASTVILGFGSRETHDHVFLFRHSWICASTGVSYTATLL
jgi:hypothetical protein